MNAGHDWLLLLYTLPARKGTSRVSLWRQLKKSGAIALKTSTYVLPDESQHRERFQWLAQQVRESGGDATLIYATDIEGRSDEDIMRTFNAARAEEYAAFVAEIGTLISANRKKPGETFIADLERFASRFEDLAFVAASAWPDSKRSDVRWKRSPNARCSSVSPSSRRSRRTLSARRRASLPMSQ